MAESLPQKSDLKLLLRVLTAHFRALVAAGSDRVVLKQYSALLRSLKSGKWDFLGTAAEGGQPSKAQRSTVITAEELNRASLDHIARLVSDEATPRKDLEFIAIQRFSVPHGSMRSSSNRAMLVDKLLTLIDNERAHQTIGAVARGQVKGNS